MDIRLKANSFLKAAQDTAKAYYDWKGGKSWWFKEGDLVWLESTNITHTLGVKKLAPRQYGLFVIVLIMDLPRLSSSCQLHGLDFIQSLTKPFFLHITNLLVKNKL
jgi:hypothetical protein